MMAFLYGVPAGATALLAGIAAGGFWLMVRVGNRRERRARHAQPCRRCGARN